MRLVTILFVVFAQMLNAQVNTSAPKLRITSGLFQQEYELGDKTVKYYDVQAHLDTKAPDAGQLWSRANANSTAQLLWTVVGAGGMLVGTFADRSGYKLAGYSTAVVGFSTSLVFGYKSRKNMSKARYLYNHKYGYE